MMIQRTVYASPVEALAALIRALVTYEQRYQMSSADFYARSQRGDLGDAADFVEWAGDYQHFLQFKDELEQKLAAAGWTPLRSISPRSARACRVFLMPTASDMRHRSCP